MAQGGTYVNLMAITRALPRRIGAVKLKLDALPVVVALPLTIPVPQVPKIEVLEE